MATEKKLTGKVPREAIRMLELPRLPQEIIAGFTHLVDLTGTVSDAMDNLGLAGAIPASVLAPTLPGKRIVGQAVTASASRTSPPARLSRCSCKKNTSSGYARAGIRRAQVADLLKSIRHSGVRRGPETAPQVYQRLTGCRPSPA